MPKPRKKESQLDRIERKLDELLSRPHIHIEPSPGTWHGPAPEPSKEPKYPRDHFGNPVPYAATWGGNDSTEIDAAMIRAEKEGAGHA